MTSNPEIKALIDERDKLKLQLARVEEAWGDERAELNTALLRLEKAEAILRALTKAAYAAQAWELKVKAGGYFKWRQSVGDAA